MGDVVSVRLAPADGEGGVKVTFGDPASSDERVLAPIAEKSGDFTAGSEGSVDITARATCKDAEGADATCPDGSDWKVTVTVGAGPV